MNLHPPQIRKLSQTQLIGLRIQTTAADNKTRELWQAFKPRVKEIAGIVVPNAFYSVQVFSHQGPFTPQTKFEKWAAVEVKEPGSTPEGMELLTLPEGAYAVFIHKGLPSDFPETAQYIFSTWLPNSEYALDDRPQFELMDDQYRPDDPEAEEEVWVPVRREK
jgi:AraC family transcriptional regulator